MRKRPSHVVVVGGGIAGVAAALATRDDHPGASITIVEASSQLGGKLRTRRQPLEDHPTAGVTNVDSCERLTLEDGAEAFSARQPEAVRLANRLNLEIIYPSTTRAHIFSKGSAYSFPPRTLMGIPTDVDAVKSSGLLSPVGVEQLMEAPELCKRHYPLATFVDESVGALVRSHLGSEVVDKLVDPLLGGVYAARADDLSLAATIPALARILREQEGTQRNLVAAARKATVANTSGSKMATVTGGIDRLVHRAADVSGARILCGHRVVRMAPRGSGWELTVVNGLSREVLAADAVILACPARQAARLLSPSVSEAGRLAAAIEYASVGVVTFVAPGGELPEGSGVLIPPSEGFATKAITFVSNKWARGHAGERRWASFNILRASVGRAGEEHLLRCDDKKLADRTAEEVSAVLDAMGASPLTCERTQWTIRWGEALPQYTVGHIDRVRQIRDALPPRLAVAGAAYDGVGIASCVRSGQDAVRSLA